MSEADFLHWLPPQNNFKAALDAALKSHGQEQLSKFLSLSGYRLGFLETIQLDRMVREILTNPPSQLTVLRVAVMSDTTVDHLLPAIRVAGLRYRLWVETYIGGYGQVHQEILDERSGLHEFHPDVVLLALDPRDELSAISLSSSRGDAAETIDRIIVDRRRLWTVIRETLRASVIQQTALNAASPVFGQFDTLVPGAPAQLIAELNRTIRAAAEFDNVPILDIARSSEQLGMERWFDPARWHLAKQTIAPTIAPLFGDLVARLLAALRGLSRKCVVVDLDNTLWGGVIGDDGLQGIVLGQGNAAGEAYVAFQRYLKLLTERGVLLAVCSKNAPETAERAFREHPEMILKREDVAAFAVNWNDKTSNLRELAKVLNIGLDSLVFFDDNPFEREVIRKALPMVAVPEVPEDPSYYVRCLAEAGYFETVSYTQEDRDRVRQYALNAERERVRGSASNMEEFLRGLEMRMEIGSFVPADLARVTQLINKTNQFNVATKRYTMEQVKALLDDPGVLTFQARMRDRLSDNGLISVVILRKLRDSDVSTYLVDTWLMSCRVLGRQVEHEVCNAIVNGVAARGASCIRGAYYPTPKNELVRELFPTLGFTAAGALSEGATAWELQISDFIPHVTCITVE